MTEADRVVAFVSSLTHTGDYAGEPFNLRPWQEEILRRIFGPRRPDGTRLTRKAFLALPRKQGKTELWAALGLYLTIGTGRTGQHVYTASGDHKQAALIFRAAASMVRNNPTLSRLCTVYDGYKRIEYPAKESFLEALSSEAPTKHGLGPSAVLFDEVHVLRDRELHDVLTTGFGARREPFTGYITTAGYDRHSLCWELWDYARMVRDGVIDDPAFCPILYEAGPKDDWASEEVWKRVMPALGDFCSIDFLRDECRAARELPARENTFRQLYLNQWTESKVRWISLDAWDGCRAEKGIDWHQYEGRDCWGGLDLSSTSDLSALVWAFENDLGGFDLLARFWLPGESAEKRARRDGVPYPQWVREGWIEKTDGARIDYERIEEQVREDAEFFRVKAIAYDPPFAQQLAARLYADGNGLPMVALPNTFSRLNEPSKRFESLIVERKLRHDGNPVLRWNVANASTAEKAGMILPSKARSTERIDGVAASVMSLAAAGAAVLDTGPSVYETRGAIFL